MTTPQNDDDLDLGYDLKITKANRRNSGAGTWVSGTLHGHNFEALVFPEHAHIPAYEIDDSRISKLWLQRQSDKVTVYNWDRGADIEPADKIAAAIVGFLCCGLADHTYTE